MVGQTGGRWVAHVWKHGSVRTLSPSSNSDRQIEHCSASVAAVAAAARPPDDDPEPEAAELAARDPAPAAAAAPPLRLSDAW